jgi:hypothetical protein
VDFSADSDSDYVSRRKGSFCSDSGNSETPSPISSRAASPRVTIEPAPALVGENANGGEGHNPSSVDAQTSEEEIDCRQGKTKRNNKWKRFTRSFSVGNMWKSQEVLPSSGTLFFLFCFFYYFPIQRGCL